MFATIRKHQTWLWAFIIAAVIVSFVIYFTPGVSRDRSGGYATSFGKMYGQTISRQAMMDAYNEVLIEQFLSTGSWADRSNRRQGVDLDRQARERLVLNAEIKQLGIEVDDKLVADWIEQNLANPNQPKSAVAVYERVLAEIKRHGLTEADLARYIRQKIGLSQLFALVGVSGQLATPREAAIEYRRLNERLEADAVVFSMSNYLASVQVNDASLAQYYTNNQSRYRIPEKVVVDYLRFDLTNYTAAAELELAKQTNLAAFLDQMYLQAGANRFLDTNGQVMTPDAAKLRIREDLLKEQSRTLARRDAANFGTELFKLQPAKAENLRSLAAQKGKTVGTTAPFSENESPAGLKVRPTFNEVAFKLTPEKPISSSIVGDDAVYVLAYVRRIPSEIPPLDAVRARVQEDYRRDQAIQLARQAGGAFDAALTNQLAQGKAFAEVCTEAKVTPLSLPLFTASSRNIPTWDRRVSFEQARFVAANLKTNTASGFLPTPDGGFVLYLKRREPVTDAELKDALPQYLTELRNQQKYEAFNEWFSHQIVASGITMPKESETELQ